MFHYLFPPLSIGLGAVPRRRRGRLSPDARSARRQVARFWTRVFALNFAIGVATGIVMEFEFGTNWATYSRFVGDVFGSALAAEGIFAFFLESGFLAMLVFGWDRPAAHPLLRTRDGVPRRTLQRASGSSSRIPGSRRPPVITSSGGERPARRITDFWAVVFNPSSMNRLTHVVLGAWWRRLLRDEHRGVVSC